MFTRMLSTKTSITDHSFRCAHIVSHGRWALGKRRCWRSSRGPHQYGGRSSSREARLAAGLAGADGGRGVCGAAAGDALGVDSPAPTFDPLVAGSAADVVCAVVVEGISGAAASLDAGLASEPSPAR